MMAVKNKILTDKEIIKAFNIVVESKGKDAVFANVNIKKEASCEYKHIALTFGDILDLLNRQNAEMERLQAERDMAVKDLHANTKCHICQHLPDDGNMTHCPHYASCGLAYIHFKWRGATKERES